MAFRFDNLEKINLEAISSVRLTWWIKNQSPGTTLLDCHQVAKALKEAHRLGVIRGKAVN